MKFYKILKIYKIASTTKFIIQGRHLFIHHKNFNKLREPHSPVISPKSLPLRTTVCIR